MFPIDLVYLWVDGNDPLWLKRRNEFDNAASKDSGSDCKARFIDNLELKYSLRSVERYAPWINNIFIVTDRQIPEWLDTSNPKIKIIDHTEILPQEVLPTFNSCVIEHALFKIPGLSEYFIYANDDMFLNREATPEDFFTADGAPIIRLTRRLFRKLTLALKEKIFNDPISNYNLTIQNAASLVKKKYGKYIGHKTHHNIDAYRKSLYEHTFEVFKADILPTLSNHLRSDSDIQRNIYSYVPIAEKKGKIEFVTRKTSLRFPIEKLHYYKKLEKHNPMFLCMNDSQYASDEARLCLREFLQKRFPEKSMFEK